MAQQSPIPYNNQQGGKDEQPHKDRQKQKDKQSEIAHVHGVDAHIKAGCTSVVMVTAMVTIVCAIIALNLGHAKPTTGSQVTTETQIPSTAPSKFNAKINHEVRLSLVY